jgi:hypothetical protein
MHHARRCRACAERVFGTLRFFIPDAEGAEVAQKTQRRNPKNFKKLSAFVLIRDFPLFVFSASSAQLLRPLRPLLFLQSATILP